jgi:hypothetical protein
MRSNRPRARSRSFRFCTQPPSKIEHDNEHEHEDD